MAEEVSVHDAIVRSIDNFAMEKSVFYERMARPQIEPMAKRLVEDLDAFGYKIVKK